MGQEIGVTGGLPGQGGAYRVDGALVPRERFYALACDPARSVVVEACAGAGKTWMLVSRILRALLDGVPPQDIVAITFTRKAAGEMRQRLSEWLAEFAQADEGHRVQALIDRGMLPAQAAAAAPRLAGLQQSLLCAGRQVEIRTFHAWFSQLLRAAPLELLQELGMAPELQLLEDEAELKPDLWRMFHAKVLADSVFLDVYQGLVEELGRSKLLSWLEAAFDKRVELRMAQEAGVLEASVPDFAAVAPQWAHLPEPMAAFATLRPLLSGLARELGRESKKTPQKVAGELEQALGLDDDARAFSGVWSALFTGSGTPRQHLGTSEALTQAVAELTLMRRALDQRHAKRLHQGLCALSQVLLRCFEDLKLARGLVDMNDLERGALALLARPELAGWVQQRLDSHVKQLLIDEFQDTSPLQWHALYGWLSAYAGAGGGASGQGAPSVFIVGDPKQSIYRFRRAEPKVFAAARSFLVEALGAHVLACDHTRRNAPSVLAQVNRAFAQAQAAQQYEGFRPHSTEVGERDPLEGVLALAWEDGQAPESLDGDESSGGSLSGVAGSSPEGWRPSLTQARHEPEVHRRAAEARLQAVAIHALIHAHGVLPGEIFVLARKRDPLRALAAELKALNIPHAAPEAAALLEQPDVRDLLAVLDALVSPGHDLSLAQALRAPAFDVSNEDLVALAQAAGRWRAMGAHRRPDAESERRSWWQALMTGPEVPDAHEARDASRGGSELDAECQAWPAHPVLERARQLLMRWQAMAPVCTPHELLSAIVIDANWLQAMAARVPPSEFHSRQAAVHALLALALDLDGGRFASLYGFVRALRKRSLEMTWPTEPQAVQLLTVHGAKGLEARVVFIMDADAAPARADHSTVLVDWPVEAEAPRRVAFVASESKPPPALEDLLADEMQQRQREELNALYVAMTRARQRLVISRTVSARSPSGPTWWSRLAPELPLWSVEPGAAGSAAAGAQGQVTVRLRQLPDLRVKPTLLPPDDPRDDSALIGEAMHRVLEWVSGPQGAEQSLDPLLGAAAQMYGLDARRSERMQRSVRAILASKECAPFLDPAGCDWSGNEVALHWQGSELRIDRLIRRAGVWWVLDYKLNAAPQRDPNYLEQMKSYVLAVSALQPAEPVRAAFVTGEGRLIDCADLLGLQHAPISN